MVAKVTRDIGHIGTGCRAHRGVGHLHSRVWVCDCQGGRSGGRRPQISMDGAHALHASGNFA